MKQVVQSHPATPGSTVLCSAQALPETSSELGLSDVLEPHKTNKEDGVKHQVLLLCRGKKKENILYFNPINSFY